MAKREKLREFYADLYKYHETYGGMEDTDENWATCAEEGERIADKHGGSQFVCTLIALVYVQIEKEVRK